MVAGPGPGRRLLYRHVRAYLLLEPGGHRPLPLVTASPLAFGRFLFQKYWFGVEIASFLLFVALVGALYLGRSDGKPEG